MKHSIACIATWLIICPAMAQPSSSQDISIRPLHKHIPLSTQKPNEWTIQSNEELSKLIKRWQQKARFEDVYIALGGTSPKMSSSKILHAETFCEALIQLQTFFEGETKIEIACKQSDGLALVVMDQESVPQPDPPRYVPVRGGCAAYIPEDKLIQVTRPSYCPDSPIPTEKMFLTLQKQERIMHLKPDIIVRPLQDGLRKSPPKIKDIPYYAVKSTPDSSKEKSNRSIPYERVPYR